MRRAADPQNRAAYRNTSVTLRAARASTGTTWIIISGPNAIGRYSFDDQNNIVFNKFDKLFDVAIMMDCSQCPVHPQLGVIFTEFAKKSSDAARKNGAKPAFFMSWAYADKPEMTAQWPSLTIAGNANDAFVIPVGLAFAAFDRQAPGFTLMHDKRHPSMLGTYLSAATVYASLYRESPVENSYTAGIDAETARFLNDRLGDRAELLRRAASRLALRVAGGGGDGTGPPGSRGTGFAGPAPKNKEPRGEPPGFQERQRSTRNLTQQYATQRSPWKRHSHTALANATSRVQQ